MLYRSTDKTEATEIVIIDSQMNYRGKLDTYHDGFMDLKLFKTMVLYIYGITANIIRNDTAYILLGKDFKS